jgi:hypothetical protein
MTESKSKRSYECNECNSTFASSSNLARHKRSKHLEKLEEPKKKEVHFNEPITPTTSEPDLERYIHDTVKLYVQHYMKQQQPKSEGFNWFNPALLKIVFLSVLFVINNKDSAKDLFSQFIPYIQQQFMQLQPHSISSNSVQSSES